MIRADSKPLVVYQSRYVISPPRPEIGVATVPLSCCDAYIKKGNAWSVVTLYICPVGWLNQVVHVRPASMLISVP